MTKQDNGRVAEQKFASFMRFNGIAVHLMPYNSKHDFEIAGQRVELKTAKLRLKSKVISYAGWFFNIHRHNILNNECDVYILKLEEIPFLKKSVYMLKKAPIESKTWYVGLRGLLQGQYIEETTAFNDWLDNLKRQVTD